MKIPALLSIAPCAVALLAPAIGCAAPRHDFNSVVSTVEQRYSVHAQHVPLMGFVNFCSWIGSRGGISGMHIAEFDNVTLKPDDDLREILGSSLGDAWQPFVTEHDQSGEQDAIFVQPHGAAMRMIVADYENGELDLVRLEVNGSRLRGWLHDPAHSARDQNHHNPQ